MGQFVFKLPDVGEGTAEAEIVAWHVRVGDVVQEDAPLVDVMTDKATVEMTSPVAGRIVSIHGEPGDMAPVGGPIAFVRKGDSISVDLHAKKIDLLISAATLEQRKTGWRPVQKRLVGVLARYAKTVEQANYGAVQR